MASEYFQRLTDMDFAVDAAMILAAYLAPSLYGPAVESLASMNIPNEVHGIVEIVAAQAVLDGDTRLMVQYGGAVYTLDQLLSRFGVRQTLMQVANGGN